MLVGCGGNRLTNEDVDISHMEPLGPLLLHRADIEGPYIHTPHYIEPVCGAQLKYSRGNIK